jgi:hypothetical protein
VLGGYGQIVENKLREVSVVLNLPMTSYAVGAIN